MMMRTVNGWKMGFGDVLGVEAAAGPKCEKDLNGEYTLRLANSCLYHHLLIVLFGS
jgi:hypothetical protein